MVAADRLGKATVEGLEGEKEKEREREIKRFVEQMSFVRVRVCGEE